LEEDFTSEQQWLDRTFLASHSHPDNTGEQRQGLDTEMEHAEDEDVADGDIKMEDIEEGQESYYGEYIIPNVEKELEMDEEVL
jgi:hypothetical protein